MDPTNKDAQLMTFKPPAKSNCNAVSEGAPGRSTILKSVWAISGLAASAGSQWLIIVLLSRLGPAAVGQYTLGLAVCAPVIGLASLSLRTVIVTAVQKNFNFFDYLRLRLVLMTVALTLIGLVAALMYPGTATVIALVGVAKALDSVGDIFTGLFQRYEQMQTAALSLISNAVFSVGLAALLLVETSSPQWVIVGSVVGSFVGSVIMPAFAAQRSMPRFRPFKQSSNEDRSSQSQRLLHLFAISLPLGLALGIACVSVNLPRIFVESYLGQSELGIFAVAGYVVLVANMCFTAIAQTMMPRMARSAEQGNLSEVTRTVFRLAAASTLCGIAALSLYALFGRQLIAAIYGPSYVTDSAVLVTFGIAGVVSGPPIFLGAYLSVIRRFNGQAVISLVTLCVTLFSCIIFVKHWALLGAGLATICGIIAEILAKLVVLRGALRGRVWR